MKIKLNFLHKKPILKFKKPSSLIHKVTDLTFTTLNPFIFIRNKHRVMSSEGFSALEKNAVIYPEGCTAHRRVYATAPCKE
jgi:hypothetical protein